MTKGADMEKDYAKTYRTWRLYRDAYKELSRLSDRDLRDIGVNRGDIHALALKAAGL